LLKSGPMWRVPIHLCCKKVSGEESMTTLLMSDPDFLIYLDHGTDTKWIKVSMCVWNNGRVADYSAWELRTAGQGCESRGMVYYNDVKTSHFYEAKPHW